MLARIRDSARDAAFVGHGGGAFLIERALALVDGGAVGVGLIRLMQGALSLSSKLVCGCR